MNKNNKLPRILMIESVQGFRVTCVFNNGESRIIDFQELFRKWHIKKGDPEYPLTKAQELGKVTLRNQTLSWSNIPVVLKNTDGSTTVHPYEIGPDVLFEHSFPAGGRQKNRFRFGQRIRRYRLEKGLTQHQLAEKSGTSKTYISRLENDLLEPELSTLYKIVEIGLGHKILIDIR